MSEIGPHGLKIDNFDDARSALIEELKTVFGDGANFDNSARLGQLVNIVAERIADQNELIQAIAAYQSPGGARGVWLEQLVQNRGLHRKKARNSTVAVVLEARSDLAVSIPAGALIECTANGALFALDEAAHLPVGVESQTVSASAVEAGPVEAPAGTLTKIKTPVFGWLSVSNSARAVAGALEETEAQLRNRYQRAVARTGGHSLLTVELALSEISNVARAFVWENISQGADEFGVPPHHLWAVVDGGADADIARTLYELCPAGIGLYGSTAYQYDDAIRGRTREIRWGRPSAVPVFLRIEIRLLAGYPSDGDPRIRDACAEFFGDGLPLGDAFVPFSLAPALSQIPGMAVLSIKAWSGAFDPKPTPVTVRPDEYLVMDDPAFQVVVVKS